MTITAENVIIKGNCARTHPQAEPGPYVRVLVMDTGTGIPPDIMDKIFDPFFTTKEVGKGTGLGLSTALAIVKSHGGFINVYSEVGKGTRFEVYLSALETAATAPAQEERPQIPLGQGQLVLVVDDEAFIRLTAKASLEVHGYRVLTASDGQEAVSLYRQHGADIQVVLLDMMMPVMDGPATLQALQEVEPEVRVIAASGLRATRQVAEAIARGAKAFLQKPYTDEQLVAVVGEVLGDGGTAHP